MPLIVVPAPPGWRSPARTQPRSAVSQGWLAVVWIVSPAVAVLVVVLVDGGVSARDAQQHPLSGPLPHWTPLPLSP
jgi:hypothetical protein